MGLLTVYQIDLSGSSIFGSGTSIPARQQVTAQRATIEFVTGKGFFKPDTTTDATAPFLGKFGATPQYPYLLEIDQTEQTSVSVGTMASGASQTITTNVGFNLPQLTLDPTDNATLLLVPNVFLNPIVSGLVVASVQLIPQALNANSQWVSAQTLQGGQAYTSWRAQVTIGLVATAATSATTLSVGATALLTVLPQ